MYSERLPNASAILISQFLTFFVGLSLQIISCIHQPGILLHPFETVQPNGYLAAIVQVLAVQLSVIF